MTDLAERLADLKQRNQQTFTDEEAKEVFLGGLYRGLTKGQAAREAGRTSTWFRRRCNPDGSNYDPVFADRYEHAAAANREELTEDVFTALIVAAKEGNVRAQEKALAHLSPEWSWLKPQIAAGGVNIEQLQVFFGELPLEKLLELKSARDQTKKALPAVIDQ